MATLEYWFDSQQKRFLEQVVRAFDGFQWQDGGKPGQAPQLHRVPVTMAVTDRLVASLIKSGSDNTVLTVPMITVWQSGLEPRRDAIQNPTHVDTRQVWERNIIANTNTYSNTGGNRYTVQRLMPRPFTMKIQVDIWTSNMEQKHQLSEQILTVFFPNIEIQNSESALDWSARTYLSLDEISWTSKSVSGGTDAEIDIMSLSFSLPMWLSPPAKVKQQKIIEQIITNINDSTEEIINTIRYDSDSLGVPPQTGTTLAQCIVTPEDAHIVIDENNVVTLLGPDAGLYDKNGQLYNWANFIAQYGNIYSDSTLNLRVNTITSANDITGSFAFTNAVNQLQWTPNSATFPAATLPALTAIINPYRVYPGFGGLANTAVNQNYLVMGNIQNNVNWGNTLVAHENDIITYNGTEWNVTFSAKNSANSIEYVTNNATGTNLKWMGADWVLLLANQYGPGWWRLVL